MRNAFRRRSGNREHHPEGRRWTGTLVQSRTPTAPRAGGDEPWEEAGWNRTSTRGVRTELHETATPRCAPTARPHPRPLGRPTWMSRNTLILGLLRTHWPLVHRRCTRRSESDSSGSRAPLADEPGSGSVARPSSVPDAHPRARGLDGSVTSPAIEAVRSATVSALDGILRQVQVRSSTWIAP